VFDRGSFVSRGNLSRDNGAVGFGVGGAVGSLTNDHAINNASWGVDIVDTLTPLDNAVAVITNVLARNNELSGFSVKGGGDATYERSRAFSNGEFGFYCGDIGTGSVTDLGRNQAKMNAWAPQGACELDL
jgi:hypothetical protein